jgi:hypothetical protein
MPGDREGGKYLVLGDSITGSVGSEYSDNKVECFLCIRMENCFKNRSYSCLTHKISSLLLLVGDCVSYIRSFSMNR